MSLILDAPTLALVVISRMSSDPWFGQTVTLFAFYWEALVVVFAAFAWTFGTQSERMATYSNTLDT